MRSSARGRHTRVVWGKQAFSNKMRQYVENGKRYVQSAELLLMTNRKLPMRFRLTPRSMTMDDI